MNQAIRVRFAPSPTGQVHIGNIRTAIFNYLFVRHHQGKFLLRIEDTDLERSTREAIDKLLECMLWLDLDYDEEILYQSSRAGAHLKAAEDLIARKQAYYGADDGSGRRPIFFRIPLGLPDNGFIRTAGEVTEELFADEAVIVAETGVSYNLVSAKGKPVPMAGALAGFDRLKLYNAAGALIFDLDASFAKVMAGEKFHVKDAVKMTFVRREVYYQDMVKGELAKPLDGIKDQIIVRGDGSPVFHLANVLDDIEQNITHIIRGDDHVENTYRHILLFHALGKVAPIYAHLPMIVNQAGKPYSKRDGDAFVGDFRSKGFLPQALFNYLTLLGWSPGDDREKMSKAELIAAFTLERVKSAPAQFDINKLLNMNGAYIAELPFDKFLKLAEACAPELSNHSKFAAVAELMQSRTKALSQVASWQYFFDETLVYDDKNCRKQLLRPEVRDALQYLAESFAAQTDWELSAIDALLAGAEAKFGFEHGKLFQGVRLAVTGVAGGADLNQTLQIIGGNSVARRIESSLQTYAV